MLDDSCISFRIASGSTCLGICMGGVGGQDFFVFDFVVLGCVVVAVRVEVGY